MYSIEQENGNYVISIDTDGSYLFASCQRFRGYTRVGSFLEQITGDKRSIRMKILVTGFEPFGGAVINPAYEAVKLLPDVIVGGRSDQN